jgi:L-glyceraldehyde 3-phosphate reductase
MTYVAADDRYGRMLYRRSGRSGLELPAVSLGLWQNFGHDRPLDTSRAIVRRAFDLGITHFDLANNYGTPYGSAETTFGRLLRDDLRRARLGRALCLIHGAELSRHGRCSLPRMPYVAADHRYERMPYRRCGGRGLKLPVVSLGLWQNFGFERPLETSRAIVRRAFDLGITHFDLANNYGPPYGSAEEVFGLLLEQDLRPFRDELVISTKAGYDMWPGPYGEWGSRKYVLASLDQSLGRMGLEYVDIFYSHRFDPETPLEETMGALATAVHQGKALYAGISSYSPEKTREAAALLRELGAPLLIHQPSYSMLNRWIEPELLDVLEDEGAGCIGFSPLAQGMLSDRYLQGVPEGSRASQGGSLSSELLDEQTLAKVRALNEIAQRRGQTLAQMALAWTLRDPRMTSTLVGVSSLEQLEANVRALDRLDFSDDELGESDRYATESDINLWARSSAD